ncbi:hypothetical protein [Companilactobacillus alimentarius]|uniref:Membrane protein 6-pyruvoyl-tetrahydropterin synthase-related domain-containing protein n=1 Tax=Companilactobacillus alimentarius DSM 20249 TaxID=1423720 RepID=A0A2K9HQM6_9LACO|nr:hypothetical protein [Companilactobacillus alimentarius]AUI71922.1 hypothetical protein LA20249_06930 [Companilactobacillus alimentarius DSM 20249]KRK77868.1 cell surface protein precursor [Companilactobacillus alimentarius DSM 20249]GEO45327.1 membrane protein [Companilactobacillus alimentarius]
MQLTALNKEKLKKVMIVLATIALFLIVSILVIYQTQIFQGRIWSYLGTSDDRFHNMRIEGLYHSLLRHQYFPFINMSFMDGFGYIVNVFYSDFLLYPAAFMRLMGYSSAQAIAGLNILLTFLTMGIAFLCFYKVSKKYWNSLVFSFVYTLSTYRMYDILYRHDLGEVGAFVFLPVALLGIYEIFYGKRQNWLYLTFGMTGIIYSHAISPILVAILIVIVAICQIGELRKAPQRLLSLLWATLSSVLLSLAYFLPMIEQMHHTKFLLTESSSNLATAAADFTDMAHASMNNNFNQANPGIVLFFAAIVVVVSAVKIKNKAVRHFSLIGAFMLICSTKIFPWVLLNKTPMKMIQFPWRFYMIVSLLLAVFVAADPLGIFKKKSMKIVLMVFITLISVSSAYRLVASSPLQRNTYAAYNQTEPFSIGAGQEYLPIGTNLSELQRATHKPKIQAGKAKISDFKQYGTRLSFNFKNAKNAKIDLPIIGYYGYQSTQSSGKVSKLKVDKRNNNLAQVTVNGNGKVVVDYFETTIQKASRRISFLSLLVIIAVLFINKLNLIDFSKIEGLKGNKE